MVRDSARRAPRRPVRPRIPRLSRQTASARAPSAPVRRTLCLRTLALTDFRLHRFARWSFAPGITAFAGGNGVGKTSILEALSLLQPGRGLRHAASADWARQDGSDREGGEDWAVAASVQRDETELLLATGAAGGRRHYRLDGAAVSAQELGNHLPQLWLTPMSERFFDDERAHRRRFLDRFASLLHRAHNEHLRAWERAARERLRLLAREPASPHSSPWLDGLEAGMAEHGVALARLRLAALDAMTRGLAQLHFRHFPKAEPVIMGALEEHLRRAPPANVQAAFAAELAANRERDRFSGMTQAGPHRSDLQLLHPSGRSAASASTGEQKAALLALILAQAHVLTEQFGFCPLLLLDEVLVHLDKTRRAGLVDLLRQLDAQALLTGQNAEDFHVFSGQSGGVQVEILPPPHKQAL